AGVGTLLDQLADATADVRRLETSKMLKVSALPSLVSRWLIPRLGRLTERHPELDVRVVATSAPTDFAREEIDVAIRVGRGSYEGARSVLLMHSDIFPVCSPAFLSKGPRRPRAAQPAARQLRRQRQPARPDHLAALAGGGRGHERRCRARLALFLLAHGAAGRRRRPGRGAGELGPNRRRPGHGPPGAP